MNKRIAILCACGLAVAVTAAVAPRLTSAQSRQPRPERERGGPDYDPVARLLAFDKNADGKVTRAELTDERLQALFERADTDRDGALTRAEIERAFARAEAPRGSYEAGPRPEGEREREARPRRPEGDREGFRGPGGRGGPGGPMGFGPGGPPFGFGRGMGPQPGQVLPEPLQQRLGLTNDQKKRLAEIQKDVDSRLRRLLTETQRRQLEELKQQGSRFGPGGPLGFGPRFGPGGPPAFRREGFGPRPEGEFRRPFGPRPEGDRPRPEGEPRRERPEAERPRGERPEGDRPRPEGERRERPEAERPRSERPEGPGRRMEPPVEAIRSAVLELDLTEDQKTRLEAAFGTARRSLEGLRNQPEGRERGEAAERAMARLRETLESTLTPEQKQRLGERLGRPQERRGPLGDLPERLERLDLSAEQRAKVRDLLAAFRREFDALQEGARENPEPAREKARALTERLRDQLAAILTPEQRERLGAPGRERAPERR